MKSKGNAVLGVAVIAIVSVIVWRTVGNDTISAEDVEVNDLEHQTIAPTQDDCVEFVALWSAQEIADELDTDKRWAFLNYTVDIFDIPPAQGQGNVVGQLRCSSYAQIFETRGVDFLVESRMTKVKGWLSSDHVKAIVMKNPQTNELCE